jgi:hypothetical protein
VSEKLRLHWAAPVSPQLHACVTVRQFAERGTPLFSGEQPLARLRFTEIVTEVECGNCKEWLYRKRGVLTHHQPPLVVHVQAKLSEHPCGALRRVDQAREKRTAGALIRMSPRLEHVSCGACLLVMRAKPILRNMARARDVEVHADGSARVELWADELEDIAVPPEAVLDHAAVRIDEHRSKATGLRWVCVTTPTRDAIWSFDAERAA